jgi:hypothetical protein
MSKLDGALLRRSWAGMSMGEREGAISSHIRSKTGARSGHRSLAHLTVDLVLIAYSDILINSFAAYPDAGYGPSQSHHQFLQGVMDALRNSLPAGHRDALDGQTDKRTDRSSDLCQHRRIIIRKEIDGDDMILTHNEEIGSKHPPHSFRKCPCLFSIIYRNRKVNSMQYYTPYSVEG